MSDLTYFILAIIFNYFKYAVIVVCIMLLVFYFNSASACGYSEIVETTINCMGCK